MKYVMTLILCLTGCASRQALVYRDSRVEGLIAMHNLVAGCLYDSKTFKDVKPCIYKESTKYQEALKKAQQVQKPAEAKK